MMVIMERSSMREDICCLSESAGEKGSASAGSKDASEGIGPDKVRPSVEA